MDERNCGSIKISEDVIASIAVTAALEIDPQSKLDAIQPKNKYVFKFRSPFNNKIIIHTISLIIVNV